MLIEIKQMMGKEDRSPEKAALINKANILDALRKEWADEDFQIKIIDNDSYTVAKDVEAKFIFQQYYEQWEDVLIDDSYDKIKEQYHISLQNFPKMEFRVIKRVRVTTIMERLV